jgi:endonuclease/exonuclease/phosphatase family metal-dependent hydrolase
MKTIQLKASSILLLALLLAPRAEAVECNRVKVWTFNIRFNSGWACAASCDNEWYRIAAADRQNVAESYMKAYAPDIFGLQEVMDPAESAGTRVSQLEDVKRWFPNHGVYERDRGDGERCAIFYRSSRFIRLNAGTFWMSCFPDLPESQHPLDVKSGNQRITSWVQLLDVQTSTTFFVFNGHWSLEDIAQEYSAALIRERVHQIAAGLPVILLGDFNCRETEPQFHILMGTTPYGGSPHCPIPITPVSQQDLSLVNSYREVIPTPTGIEATYHDFSGNPFGNRIDHVLHSRNDFAAVTATIRRDTYAGHCGANSSACYPSDHFAVEVGFQVLLQNVQLDFQRNELFCESGTALNPFNTVVEALNVVKTNGTITLLNSSSSAGVTINPTRGPVTITSAGGPSVIGK